jgi:formamidopyrimidine-DNA glycosylase
VPELPEVEAVARSLRPLVAGRKIRRCRVLHEIAVRPQSAAHLQRSVQARRVMAVERRGKYLLLRLDRGWIALHFRLDGQLVWFDSPRLSGHVDVALEFATGTLGFVDRRHFGRVQFLQSLKEASGIQALGVDPLSPEFTSRFLQKLLSAADRPLKLLLMDQTRIAGLGNIYSSESLWRAKLDPRRRTNRVSPMEVRRLHNSIVYVLWRALECCSHPAPDFRDANWWFQGLERILRVYQLAGKRCRRCGKRIRRLEQGGRSTFFCPGCQR